KEVAKALEDKYPKATIKLAEEVTEGDKVTYEALIVTADKKTIEVVLDPKGKIVKEEEKKEKKKEEKKDEKKTSRRPPPRAARESFLVGGVVSPVCGAGPRSGVGPPLTAGSAPALLIRASPVHGGSRCGASAGGRLKPPPREAR